jgi:hypothetical protein
LPPNLRREEIVRRLRTRTPDRQAVNIGNLIPDDSNSAEELSPPLRLVAATVACLSVSGSDEEKKQAPLLSESPIGWDASPELESISGANGYQTRRVYLECTEELRSGPVQPSEQAEVDAAAVALQNINQIGINFQQNWINAPLTQDAPNIEFPPISIVPQGVVEFDSADDSGADVHSSVPHGAVKVASNVDSSSDAYSPNEGAAGIEVEGRVLSVHIDVDSNVHCAEDNISDTGSVTDWVADNLECVERAEVDDRTDEKGQSSPVFENTTIPEEWAYESVVREAAEFPNKFAEIAWKSNYLLYIAACIHPPRRTEALREDRYGCGHA